MDGITNHQSPITNHQSPITNHQSPITNHQSPIANHCKRLTVHKETAVGLARKRPISLLRVSAALIISSLGSLALGQSSFSWTRTTSGSWPSANGSYAFSSTSNQAGPGHTNSSTSGSVTYTITVISANGSTFPTSVTLSGTESLTLSLNGSSNTPTAINPVTGKIIYLGSASSNSSASGNLGPFYSTGSGSSAAPTGPASYMINVSSHSIGVIVVPSGGWRDQGNGTSKNTFTFTINANLSSSASVISAGNGFGQANASGEDDGFEGAILG